MSKKYNYLLSVFFTTCVFSTSVYAMEWPVLDSADPQKPLHKTIISSIFGRPGEEYHGGKFKGNFFVVQGNGVDQQKNRELIQHLPRLRILLQQGNEIKFSHVGTTDEVVHFSRYVLYQIALNEQLLPFRFSLYNKGKLNNFIPFTIPDQMDTLILTPVSPPHHSHQLIEDVAAVRIGHGIWNFEAPSSQEIEKLIEKHKDHNVLGKIFAIIELAIAYDQKVLLKTIRAYPNNSINMDNLLDLMRKDRDLITQAANAFNPGHVSKARWYLPFLDQLHTLGNQGALCGRFDQLSLILNSGPPPYVRFSIMVLF